MRSTCPIRCDRPVNRLRLCPVCLSLAVMWLAWPVCLVAQAEFEGTLRTSWDAARNRNIPAAPGDTVTTFDFTGNLVSKGERLPAMTVVCTEIWYRKGGVWDWRSSRNICFYTDPEGDYFRVSGVALGSEPTDDPSRWITEGALTCEGGVGKYEEVRCDWRYRSYGTGGGSARTEITGTLDPGPKP